jgi:hypothetical protein
MPEAFFDSLFAFFELLIKREVSTNDDALPGQEFSYRLREFTI